MLRSGERCATVPGAWVVGGGESYSSMDVPYSCRPLFVQRQRSSFPNPPRARNTMDLMVGQSHDELCHEIQVTLSTTTFVPPLDRLDEAF